MHTMNHSMNHRPACIDLHAGQIRLEQPWFALTIVQANMSCSNTLLGNNAFIRDESFNRNELMT